MTLHITPSELIDQLAAALAARVAPPIPLSVDLWTVAEIAALLKRSSRHVVEHVIPLPSFPAAIRLPTKRGGGHPLWKASEVVKWIEQYQERKTRP